MGAVAAPSDPVTKLATALARRTLSSSVSPHMSPAMTPPVWASPLPIVSTTATGKPGMRRTSPSATTAPRPPSVTTAGRPERRQSAAAAARGLLSGQRLRFVGIHGEHRTQVEERVDALARHVVHARARVEDDGRRGTHAGLEEAE